MLAYSDPLRSYWMSSPVVTLNIRMIVPFSEAVANLFPFAHISKAKISDLWASIFLFYLFSMHIYTVPIFLCG